MITKEAYEYYVSDNFNPILPIDCNFRHFRVKTEKGSWRRVPGRINNRDDLVKWIVKLGGVDVYYSVSKWMQPHKISAKGLSGTYHIADNLLIGNDLMFDIDIDKKFSYARLNEARKVSIVIHDAMKDYKDYDLQYISFTGSKGFRLVYTDNNLGLPKDARHRIDYIEQKRKVFIVALLKKIEETVSSEQFLFVKKMLDVKVMVNPMCVIRVLGTVHGATGYHSAELTFKQLNQPIKKLLTHVPYIGKKRPGIPRKREMTKEEEIPRPRLLQSDEDVSGLASLPTFIDEYVFFFTNRVLGIKRGFIPVFIYQEHQTKWKKEMLALQEKYKLGQLYVFGAGDKIIVISLKTMQKRQLQKILNESRSRTKYDFRKYSRIYIPLVMNFKEKLHFGYTGNLSLGHLHYVDPGRQVDSKRYCGWSKIEVVKARRVDNDG